MLGEVIGNFRITAKLAEGGMGAVYRAEHPLLGKTAAVKVLLPEHSNNRKLVNRLFTEARSATAARHPGIVEIYDFGYTKSGAAYIVMELLDGQSLSSVLVARGKLPESEALNYTRGIASALASAHAQGITHRDLKPDNIFLVRDPDMIGGVRPKVLDFGIAKVAQSSWFSGGSHHTRTGAVIGTPTYMSPEQCRGIGKVDHRSDLYSLGCILYEMLVGKPPFYSEGIGELLSMHMYQAPVPPSEANIEVSNATESLVLGLLQKRPRDRVQTAAELVRMLAQTLVHGGPAADDPTETGIVLLTPAPVTAPQDAVNAFDSTPADHAPAVDDTTAPRPRVEEKVVEPGSAPGSVVTLKLKRTRRYGLLLASFSLTLAAGIAAIWFVSQRSPGPATEGPAREGSPLSILTIDAGTIEHGGRADAATIVVVDQGAPSVIASPPPPEISEKPVTREAPVTLSPREAAEISKLVEMSPPPAVRTPTKAARRPAVVIPAGKDREQRGAPRDEPPVQVPVHVDIDRSD